MKYRGFVIQAVYLCGSDFTVKDDGRVVNRKPTSKDVDYYEILDPDNYVDRWIAEDTIAECKRTIDAFLLKTTGSNEED